MSAEVMISSRPRLRGQVVVHASDVSIEIDDQFYDLTPDDDVNASELVQLLQALDGSRSVQDVACAVDWPHEKAVTVLAPMFNAGLVTDEAIPLAVSGCSALSAVEGTLDRHMEVLVYGGDFWTQLQESPKMLPESVYHGYAIENWHFLDAESLFDYPLASLPQSDRLRRLIQDFVIEEHRHDDLLLPAFASLGLGRDDLRGSRPLATTTALISLLITWAKTDPLFMVSTFGILEGRSNAWSQNGERVDSFLKACHEAELDREFIEPLQRHASVNASHGHSDSARQMFREIDGVSNEQVENWKAKAILFTETYAAYFQGILDYYSRSDCNLTRGV